MGQADPFWPVTFALVSSLHSVYSPTCAVAVVRAIIAIRECGCGRRYFRHPLIINPLPVGRIVVLGRGKDQLFSIDH
jgi:hypothetical protein